MGEGMEMKKSREREFLPKGEETKDAFDGKKDPQEGNKKDEEEGKD